MEEFYAKLYHDFDIASVKLKKCRTLREGGGGDEKVYAQAYARLVLHGLEPRLRYKHRG